MAFDVTDIDKGTIFFWIDNERLDYEITKEEAILKIAEKKFTVKIEGMEHLEPESNSVHMFISPKGSKSFKTHTDDVDLKILCIDGIKRFVVNGIWVDIAEDHYVLVPAGTSHKAINKYDSVILSIEK